MEQDILKSIIDRLDFSQGQLYDVSPNTRLLECSDWLNLGDWLTAARNAGAEKIFFVDNNPVVVFARCEQGNLSKIKAFNKLWCLSRPRILFLECGGELSVIDLAQAPIRTDASDNQPQLKTLETLSSIKKVAQQLQDFHRDHIESGKVFEGGRFGSIKHRADKALISDLKAVRQVLLATKLKSSYVHALIGRSIFIRYLEDRGVLTEAYFLKVAEGSPEWESLLNKPHSRENLDFSGIRAFYPRVLQNKLFTYALYRSLSTDFNGDMFPNIDEEERHVQDNHLQLIQDLLYGDVDAQKKLFFFSYKFDIIPLGLISAIYEEFYHASSSVDDKKCKARQDGAYYTPPVLAEFVLSRLLTVDVLKQSPRILDPACGSGIFLVEAFRRIIRYHISQRLSVPSFNELKQILGQQIAGIEVNEEAARITAFSLYMAMLHYLDPPSILDHIMQGNKLPNLIASENNSANHYNNIHVGNAFSIESDAVGDMDIVVGNPPWGAPGNKADKGAKDRQYTMLQWCKEMNFPIGDKEPSQAFLWRSMDFLKPNGRCALLTSAGVLFKNSRTTQKFRKEWMDHVCITEVFNFTHVRKFFFQGAISPFVLIHFSKSNQNETPVEYWSPKQVAALKETQAVLLSKYDRTYLVRQDLTDNKTWKVNWFGRYADSQFIINLSQHLSQLKEYTKFHCVGYKIANKSKEAGWLSNYNSLNNQSFDRYDNLTFCRPPKNVEHRGKSPDCYEGKRLIVKEGIEQRKKSYGRILARVEENDFSFNHSLHVLKLKDGSTLKYDLLLGIIWSSFSRYYFFLITANWGVWNDKILIEERLSLPIKSEISSPAAKKIISIVQKLRNYNPQVRNILNLNGVPQEDIDANRCKWETELDEAVFDLYELTEEQRDLIRDCCEVTLPFFYQPYNSIGVLPAVNNSSDVWILNYAERFAHRWQPYLNEGEVLRADLHVGASGNMIAMEFYPADTGDKWDLKPKIDSWPHILEEIGKALPRPLGTSQILLDGIVHVISDNSIIVIKRNEKRFWTRSIAREDADSTLAKRMMETMPVGGGGFV